MKIDVVIPTKDPCKVRPELLRVLETANWVNNVLFETSSPLSTARKRGALRASTEWLAMFDDDIEIPEDWFPQIAKHVTEGVLAVSSPFEDQDMHVKAYQKTVGMISSLQSRDTPFVCNLLIKRSVFEDYDPPGVFTCEDEILYKYVKSRGRWVHSPFLGVKHWYIWKNGREAGAFYKKYGILSKKRFLRQVLTRFIIPVFAVSYSHSLKTVSHYWRWNLETIRGYVFG